MMVEREIVRRYRQLPQFTVVDGGKEFSSVYFETLLAFYGVSIRQRTGNPKGGSVVERLFNTLNRQFVYNVIGNTQVMKNVRGVSAEVNPKALAVWTLPMFYKRLREWAYEIYDTTVHRTLGQSPRQMFAYGAKRSGQRSHRLISYDDFKILSLPAPSGRGGRRKIRRSDGIQVNYIQYWCDVFKDPRLWNRSVPVRYDPFNIDVAYAYVGSTWHQCRSRHSHLLRYRTERELQIATEAIRQRRRNGQRASMTGYQIAQFLGSVTEDEALLTEHWKALENAEILADINEERTPAPESDTPDLVEKDDDVENASDIGLGFTYDDLETYGEY